MANLEVFTAIKQFRDELNKVSPTFCSAKWLQSTILLYNGETQSCHHVPRTKIPLEGLEANPRSIHNTPIKMLARKDLIEGKQTTECDYCWRIENLNTGHISDRIYKSASPWAAPHLDEIVKSGTGENIDPTYLEVAFDTTCNFACMYCSPEVSSKWMEDAELHGPYKLGDYTMHDVVWLKESKKIPIRHNEYNPYIDAFWKWWPELYPKLHTFRITGGEPLLSKHTWKVFEWIKENPNPNIEFAINTNLNVPSKLIEKLIEEIRAIKDKVRRIKIYTSLEATGQHAEYIRHGMNYDEFMQNVNYVLSELPDVRIVFMTTISALSIFTFEDFLSEIINLRAKYRMDALGISVNYLRWPMFMDIRMLNKDCMQPYLDSIIAFAESHRAVMPGFGNAKFYLEELDQISRLREYAMQACPDREKQVSDFHLFFKQYDGRRNLNLQETFPNLQDLLI